MSNGPRWSGERDGGRWPVPASAAVLVLVAAVVLGAAGPGGLGLRLTVEGLSALALVLAVTAGVWWQRARHDQPDVELSCGYATGQHRGVLGVRGDEEALVGFCVRPAHQVHHPEPEHHPLGFPSVSLGQGVLVAVPHVPEVRSDPLPTVSRPEPSHRSVLPSLRKPRLRA